MTITGIILIPIYVVAIFLPWRYVLTVAVLSALLFDAAIVNFGNIGLQPGFVFMLLIILRTALEIIIKNQGLSAYALRATAPLVFLLLASLLTLFVAVVVFAGNVMSLPGGFGMQVDWAEPYSFRRENVAQMGYLLIDILTVYCLAHQAAHARAGDFVRSSVLSITIAGFVSALVAFWELAHFVAGVPFPFAFFHSNVAYAEAYRQTVGGTPRISGPFPEPAALGFVFGGFIQFAWVRHRCSASIWSFALLAASVATLIMSTATTAYFGLALFVLVVAKDLIFGAAGVFGAFVRGRTRSWKLLATVAVGLAAFACYVLLEWNTLHDVFNIVVVDKGGSSSFKERAAVDLMALNIFVATWGIGLGLGSHRPNSLVMTLLSNVGIVGTLVFTIFAYRVLLSQGRPSGSSLRWFVLGMLAMGAFSGPTLTLALLWIGFGLALGASIEAHKSTAQRIDRGRRPGGLSGVRGSAFPAIKSMIRSEETG